MLKNYLKTAFRNLMRQKTGTILNLAGLTLGITCSIVLVLIIQYHSSFDNFHAKKERIYRLIYKSVNNGELRFQGGVPKPLPEAFRLDFPEAEEIVFASYRSDALVRVPQGTSEDKKFQEEAGVVFTEPAFFKIFDRAIISGNAISALAEPKKAVISDKLATKYFGTTDVLGETVVYDDVDYTIAAVIEASPSNTDFPFELIFSFETIRPTPEENSWGSIWSDEHCYFLLKEDASIAEVNQRLPEFTKKYRDYERDKGEFMSIALNDMHFDTRFETFSYQTAPRAVLTILGAIAVVLIVTACINFVNLATADAIKRSREVGIRKTMGSSRGQLVVQFLGETFLLTVVAVLLSVGLSQIALGFINPFMELELSLDLTGNAVLPVFLVIVTVVVSFLSGLYPAIVVSSFRPILALKNQVENKASGGYWLRSGLVVFQFFISQFFIVGTIVLIQQTNFFMNADMGFKREAVLVAPLPGSVSENTAKQLILHQASTLPGVEQVALASAPPFSGEVNKTGFRIQDDPDEYVTQYKSVDTNYLDLFGIELIAGNNLVESDTINGILVNESFARQTGHTNPHEIVGKIVSVYSRDIPVVGVVKDFNTMSLEQKIEPVVLFNNVRGYRTLALKAGEGQIKNVVSALEEQWNKNYPDHLFEYSFIDENIRTFYESQQRLSRLMAIFTSIAIFIGCLGLFGLVSYMTNQKTKEIGVRKVLGASVEGILMSFIWKYIRLIVFGAVLAFPLGFFAMEALLSNFAYRISLSPWIFVAAFLFTVLIALITAGYKSVRTATADPVKSLRYE